MALRVPAASAFIWSRTVYRATPRWSRRGLSAAAAVDPPISEGAISPAVPTADDWRKDRLEK